MNGILQDPASLPSCLLAEGRQRRRDAHYWAVLAVATLEWTALAVAVLAFVKAGVAVWLDWA